MNIQCENCTVKQLSTDGHGLSCEEVRQSMGSYFQQVVSSHENVRLTVYKQGKLYKVILHIQAGDKWRTSYGIGFCADQAIQAAHWDLLQLKRSAN